MKRLLVLVVWLLVSLVSCSGDTSPSPGSSSPSGSPQPSAPSASATPAPLPTVAPTAHPMAYEGKISNELDGYSLTLPAGWRRIEVSPDDWAATIDQIADAPTRDMLTHYLQVARLSGVDFLAVRSADPATVGFATNVTVTVSELLDSSAQDLLEMSREQLQGIGIEQIDDKFVDLPAGSALHMAYVMPAEQFGLAYAVEQYTFFDADHFYTIALAGKLPPDIAADALAMATSFAFGPRLAP